MDWSTIEKIRTVAKEAAMATLAGVQTRDLARQADCVSSDGSNHGLEWDDLRNKEQKRRSRGLVSMRDSNRDEGLEENGPFISAS